MPEIANEVTWIGEWVSCCDNEDVKIEVLCGNEGCQQATLRAWNREYRLMTPEEPIGR